jgi:hypothetical protein
MENHQRTVLSKLSVGKRYIKKNDPSGLEKPEYTFEGRVLDAGEATEPNSIRWQDLNATSSEKLKQTMVTFVITIGAIYVCFLAVELAEELIPGIGAAFCISGESFCHLDEPICNNILSSVPHSFLCVFQLSTLDFRRSPNT